MNEQYKYSWFARRADRMDVFRADPPATKIQALRIIERGETVRFTLRLLQIVGTWVLLHYSLALAGGLKMTLW